MKKLAIGIGCLLCSLLCVLLVWVAFIALYREPLDQGLIAFYQARPHIAPEQDAAVFLDGLTAPMGEDVFQYGLLVAKNPGQASHAQNSAAYLRFTGKEDEFDCWGFVAAMSTGDKSCTSPDRIRALLKENAELLRRYHQMTALPFFGNGQQNGFLFMELNKLLSAQILLEARQGRVEQAYARWRDNLIFLNQISHGELSWTARVIWLVNYGMAQNTLEILVYEHPQLLDKHANDVLSLLEQAAWLNSPEQAIRVEHYLLEDKLLYAPDAAAWWFDANFIRNRIYRFDREFLHAWAANDSEAENEDMRAAWAKFAAHTWSFDYLRNPESAAISRQYIRGWSRVPGLLERAPDRVDFNRLLKTRVLIAQQKIAGADVPAFLRKLQAAEPSQQWQPPMWFDPTYKLLWLASRSDCSHAIQTRLPGGQFVTGKERRTLFPLTIGCQY